MTTVTVAANAVSRRVCVTADASTTFVVTYGEGGRAYLEGPYTDDPDRRPEPLLARVRLGFAAAAARLAADAEEGKPWPAGTEREQRRQLLRNTRGPRASRWS